VRSSLTLPPILMSFSARCPVVSNCIRRAPLAKCFFLKASISQYRRRVQQVPKLLCDEPMTELRRSDFMCTLKPLIQFSLCPLLAYNLWSSFGSSVLVVTMKRVFVHLSIASAL
jgi:hypothetical protein